ncbi:hypothetical protein [Paraburkholderia ferrariae]|jgi:hypothetical protein|uniref:hypothetical protein n=1 Tax=Paraburkholderia ferrariae TaxID=386056 RepID=UPI0006940439|nr:hypothetical protein [Paraburkholderia ferrariae]
MKTFTDTLFSAPVALVAAAAFALGSGVAHAQSQDPQKLAKMGVQFSATNARVAQEVCNIDVSTVSNYKTSASKKFAQDPDFEKDWKSGWQQAAQSVNGMQQMKASNPKEYEQQKAAICSDMQQQMKS